MSSIGALRSLGLCNFGHKSNLRVPVLYGKEIENEPESHVLPRKAEECENFGSLCSPPNFNRVSIPNYIMNSTLAFHQIFQIDICCKVSLNKVFRGRFFALVTVKTIQYSRHLWLTPLVNPSFKKKKKARFHLNSQLIFSSQKKKKMYFAVVRFC